MPRVGMCHRNGGKDAVTARACVLGKTRTKGEGRRGLWARETKKKPERYRGGWKRLKRKEKESLGSPA